MCRVLNHIKQGRNKNTNRCCLVDDVMNAYYSVLVKAIYPDCMLFWEDTFKFMQHIGISQQ